MEPVTEEAIMIKKNRNMMKFGLTFISLCFVQSAQADVPYRWETDYVQGNAIAAVEIKGGDSFQISCNQGGMTHDVTQDLFVSYTVAPSNEGNAASQIKGADTLQFVIDGRTFELPGNGLYLANGSLDAYGNLNSLWLIEQALVDAKQEYFQFQIPEGNFSVNISTVGAKEALTPIMGCK
jgi:hypothetical protein